MYKKITDNMQFSNFNINFNVASASGQQKADTVKGESEVEVVIVTRSKLIVS